MPIYEYNCINCGHFFEKLQRKILDVDCMTCPVCHKDTAKKIVSLAGFQLKGTGWYETDFKQKPKAPTTKEVKTTGDSD